MLGLHVGLADIFTDHADAQELDTSQKTQNTDHTGPACHSDTHEVGGDRPDHAHKADEGYQTAEARDQPDRPGAHAGDAVKSESEHFGERVVALAGDPLVALIEDRSTLETDQREHSSQKEVHFPIVFKCAEDLCRDEPVIGVIVDDLCPHIIHQFIEALRRHPLEPGVRVPAGTYAVDELASVQVLAHHLVHGVDIVLAVTVDRDRDVAVLLGLHQAGEHSVLMPPVAALGNAQKVRVFPRKRLDDLPGPVPGAIVYKQHPAFVRDQRLFLQVPDLFQKHGRRDRQDRFFVVTWDHNPQDRLFLFHVFTILLYHFIIMSPDSHAAGG